MKTTKQIETEVRGIFSNAKWDRHFTKTASKVIEEIRKENNFADFTTKQRVAILESIAQALMNYQLQFLSEVKKLKRDVLLLMLIVGLITGLIIGNLVKGNLG